MRVQNNNQELQNHPINRDGRELRENIRGVFGRVIEVLEGGREGLFGQAINQRLPEIQLFNPQAEPSEQNEALRGIINQERNVQRFMSDTIGCLFSDYQKARYMSMVLAVTTIVLVFLLCAKKEPDFRL
ncbi:MAG: hypothetical protein P4L16_04710 [Chlamydiales bacterium]|nr:hypothetical protein [Chlamydiales bacterium]